VGCLLAVLLHRGYLPRLWQCLCTQWMSMLTLLLLITSVWLSQVFGSVYRNVVGFAIDPLLVAALIAQVIALRESPFWQWLNWRWVRYLGALSYSIYLYQQVVIGPVKEAFASYPLVVQLAAVLAAVVLVASASYHFVERPFLRLKGRIASAPRRRARPPSFGRAAPMRPVMSSLRMRLGFRDAFSAELPNPRR
jgi:peptidoglycan/LPS O-acetylase OafA/YrhL